MESLAERVAKTGLLKEKDCVVAAVSGGADSTCLLLILMELKNKIGFDFSVLHVEHGIRGEESRQDASFVEGLCEEHGIRFFLKEVNVPSARKIHISEEETARNLRRAAYAEAAGELYPGKEVKVALAHNADDQAETVLMHLIRGTGIKGLGGMEEQKRMQSDGSGLMIIRPLLGIERREIESYLQKKDQRYRTDATNEEDTYTRNCLRHHILPKLRELNEQAVSHIGHTAEVVRKAEKELEGSAVKLAVDTIVNGRLNRVYTLSCPNEIRSRLIKAWIFKQNGTVRNISSTHIGAIDRLLSAPNGTKADIPGSYRACVEGEYIVWEKKTGRNSPQNEG